MNATYFRCLALFTGLLFAHALSANKHNLRLIVRLDDCYLSGDSKIERIIQLFARYKQPLNVGIIPFNIHVKREKDTFNPMFLNPYAEIFLHGYQHEKNIDDEFSGLSYAEQRDKIQKGRKMIESYGIYPDCFAPPWNGYDKNTLTALNNSAFRIITANEFGNRNHPKMGYMPSTCYSIKEATATIQRGSMYKGILVLLIHPYDFTKEADFILLENLLKSVQSNKVTLLYFSNLLSLDENITNNRLDLHHHILFNLLRKNNLLGFRNQVYYESSSLIFINIIEWLLLLIILIYLHLKIIIKHIQYNSFVTGIFLLFAVIISYQYKQDSYRWILLYKTLLISFFIWLNNRVILRQRR
jgi:peptidoglycan/xylan/chitin deacetylase (PgdA/CDA1 family)